MAVVFKRLPAMTFRSMLTRPQSTAGHGEVHGERSLSASPPVSSWLCLIWQQPLPLPFDSVGFKINILLHVLLITTNLNLYNSLPYFPTTPPPNSQHVFLSFSLLLHFPQEMNAPKITLTRRRQSRQTQGIAGWLGSAPKMSWN